MKKIGISARIAIDSSERNKNYRQVTVSDNYVKSICASGGVPIVLPVITDIEIIEEQLKLVDGLILTGGEDVDPLLYGEEHFIKNGVPSVERDTYDINLIRKAFHMQVPILGICRGAQILNVALGGTLYQDLSYKENVFIKHDQFGNHSEATHKVKIEKDSFLFDILGEGALVNSFHHQAVKILAPSLRKIAISTDGVIEAFENVDKDVFTLGIQWHPEMMGAAGNEKMIDLFKKFILTL